MKIAALSEPNRDKMAFFTAIQAAAGGGTLLANWPVSPRGYPETAARAADCLARAKKQPKGPVARAAKRAFLQGRYNWARRWFSEHPDHAALCWQGLTGARRAVMLAAQDAGAATFFAELSPLPGTKTLDPHGVNAESAVPRDPAFYTDVIADDGLLDDIKGRFVARASVRADVGQGQGNLPDTPYLFVPLQVPDDSQMLLFSGWVGSVAGFVAALSDAARVLPRGWHIRVKEHPSAKVRFADLVTAAGATGAPMVLDNDTDSFAQVAGSRGVVTVNSSMGLQAMFWNKPVIATGAAFWAIPGIADHAPNATALSDLCAAPDTLSFDAGLRARFLTWLAKTYYIPDTHAEARIAARLKGDLT